MNDLIQHLDDILATTQVDDLWDLHVNKMKQYGFDRLIFGFTRYCGETSFGDPDDWLVLTTQSPEYMNVFIGEGLYFDAPMLRWSMKNRGACSWRWMTEPENIERMTPAERRVLEFNRSMGVTAGYTISFLSVSARTKGAIALTAAKGISQGEIDATWDKHGREILLMNNVMHTKIQTLPYSGDRRLTSRQREVLQWVGDGKSIQDIAVLLGRKPATIEKHLRLAREALGVETTAQAVLKAALFNQMFLPDTDVSG